MDTIYEFHVDKTYESEAEWNGNPNHDVYCSDVAEYCCQ